MLHSIQISNLQSHKNTKLEFVPGLNVIVGPTDSGKTAIIRALKWLVWNRPQGDSIRSNWGGDTIVELQTDSNIIKRTKTNQSNEYVLDKTKFNAVGTNIPEEIQIALNLDEINLQQQLDSPFLLTSSPGEVAKHFNKVVHLDMIDKSMQSVQKWIREIEQDIKGKGNQIEQSKEELSQYFYLDEMEGKIIFLENIERRKIPLYQTKERISEILSQIDKIRKDIDKYSNLISLELQVNQILGFVSKKKQLDQDMVSLLFIADSLQHIKENKIKYNCLIKIEKLVNQIFLLVERRRKKEEERGKLRSLISNIVKVKENLKIFKELLVKMEKKFHSSFPNGICPLCGAKV